MRTLTFTPDMSDEDMDQLIAEVLEDTIGQHEMVVDEARTECAEARIRLLTR